MARTYKSKNVQSKKELSGAQNIPDSHIKRHALPEEENILGDIVPLLKRSFEQRKRGCNWSPEDMEEAIMGYFSYCEERSLKPCKAGLQLYLGCSRDQYWEWQTKPEKYGAISDLVRRANTAMEMQYVNRLESYPTGNIFLLKTGYGYVETSKVEVNTSASVTTDEINDAISKLGLDKTE